MRRYFAVFLMILLAFLAGTGRGGAQEVKDHPLISRYPGSEFQYLYPPTVKQFDEIALPVGPYVKGKFTKTERLEGKVTRLPYTNPRGRSTLEIFRNYEQALTKGGFQTLFTCNGADCGDASNEPTADLGYWCVTNKIQCPEPMRYIAAKLSRAEGDVYAAIKVRTEETDIVVVELKPIELGLVKVKSDVEMKSDITAVGHTPLYGVYFDTGKAEVKPNSDATLSEIAKLMKVNPTMKLHVVGHTDNAGTLASNMTLSKQRANAVVQALVAKYQITGNRLDAAGVGSLAPVATNRTEDGRAKNRRVELVEQ